MKRSMNQGTSHSEPSNDQTTAQPIRLDYAPPVGRSRAVKLIIGISASLFFAFGTAMLAFGVMLGLRNDRDAPGFVATGVGLIVFGVGVIVSAWLARR